MESLCQAELKRQEEVRGRGEKLLHFQFLTQKEADQVQADEQSFLAGTFGGVVVQSRAAPILRLRDHRLVVLVVLHGGKWGDDPMEMLERVGD